MPLPCQAACELRARVKIASSHGARSRRRPSPVAQKENEWCLNGVLALGVLAFSNRMHRFVCGHTSALVQIRHPDNRLAFILLHWLQRGNRELHKGGSKKVAGKSLQL